MKEWLMNWLNEPVSGATLLGLAMGWSLYYAIKELIDWLRSRHKYDEALEWELLSGAFAEQGKKWRRRYLWWRRNSEAWRKRADEYAWKMECAEVERDRARRELMDRARGEVKG